MCFKRLLLSLPLSAFSIVLSGSFAQAQNAVMVKDINPGSVGSMCGTCRDNMITYVNNILYFGAWDPTYGTELWKSDGTEAGTRMVKDIYPGNVSSYPTELININGTVFFMAWNPTYGTELWKSDGTEAGTIRMNIYPRSSYSSYDAVLTNINGTLYFVANYPPFGLELWKSDGTEDGTSMVKDIFPGNGSGLGGNGFYQPYSLANVNGTLFFRADDGIHGPELWKTDGTPEGTVLVKDIFPGSGRRSADYDLNMTNVNGTLYFRADDGIHGLEIWKSDGTEDGTVMVKDIFPGSISSNSDYSANLTNGNGILYFSASDGTFGQELWKSDGTEAGTVLVGDMVPGSDGSYPLSLTNVNGTVFFSAFNTSTGYELWKSDGTFYGTQMVKNIGTGGQSSMLNNAKMIDVSGVLYFPALTSNGQELWKSDGTEAGTVLVMDIFPGSQSSELSNFTSVNGTLYFTANNGTNGLELWKTTAKNQTITFTSLPAKTFGDAPFPLSATASSGLAVSFSVVSGPATLSGNTLTITGAGTVVIKASQAGNANYNAATDVEQSFPVNKANQTIAFPAINEQLANVAPFPLMATASSGLGVNFSVVSGPATILGATLTITGAGVVKLKASQAGNANYNAAPNMEQTFTINKANQTIAFTLVGTKTFGDAAFDLSTTSSAGLTVAYSVVSGPASLSGKTLTLTGAGTVIIKATQEGNAVYNAANTEQTVTVNKATQVITFTPIDTKTFGDAAFSLNATASSGLDVIFSVASGPATVSGSTLTLTGAGTVKVNASQAGNADYLPASAEQTFVVNAVLAVAKPGSEEVEVFPNPASTVLQVRLPLAFRQASLVLLTMQGQSVLHQAVQGQSKVELALPPLPQGLYLLQIGSGKQLITRKIVVQ